MRCHLCLKDKDLKNSHIIPEFLYKPLYDDIHRFKSISTLPEEKNGYKQKGIREKLLCRDCEQYLSELENYASQIFYRDNKLKIIEYKRYFVVKGINYKQFKLFQLSLLWRAGVSRDNYFSDIKLEHYEEKLRKMLLSKNPGEPHEFGCPLTIFSIEENKPTNGLIVLPKEIRIDNQRCFVFVLGGFFWHFIVSKHSKNFIYNELFLKQDGNLIIVKNELSKTIEWLKGISKKLN